MKIQRKQAGFAEPHSILTIGWAGVGLGLGWGWVGVVVGLGRLPFGSSSILVVIHKNLGPEKCFCPENSFGPPYKNLSRNLENKIHFHDGWVGGWVAGLSSQTI